MKEHHAAARLGHLEKSAVAEHAWQEGHTINWSGVRILDEASRNSVLLIKEAMHIRLRSTDGTFNRDTGWTSHNVGYMPSRTFSHVDNSPQ